MPKVSVASAGTAEGNSGIKNLVFTLTLSEVSALDVSVQVNTHDETAVAGLDYQAVHQAVTIAAGATTATISVPIIGNTTFQPNRGFEVNLSDPVNASVAGNAWGVIVDDDKPANLSLPTDPGYPYEWYIYTVRAEFAWQLATGTGVKVGVFDQGIDSTHPDLHSNVLTALGRIALTLAPGGEPMLATDNHGTWVAGVIAAARDGQGEVGIAYDAKLVSIYTSSAISDNYFIEIAQALSYAKSLDILNNSWGFGNQLKKGTNWAFFDNAQDPLFAPAFRALNDLAGNGRNGLGTIVVQSAGNAYAYGDDTNLHNFQNSRYIITVGSTDYFGHISPFSTSGASILVSAPGGGGSGNYDSISTTTRMDPASGKTSYYAYVDGTSFSAPVVSGVVALMLQANPNLGYRDVQQILAYTAQPVITGKGSWSINGAGDWNGGGLHYNSGEHSSGFGQVDALAAVRLAAAWNAAPQTVANAKEVIVSQSSRLLIPDNSPSGITSSIAIAEPMTVERADVTIHITHPFVGNLEILLTSPSGTESWLLRRPSQGALSAFGSTQHDVNFTFDTVLDWGESAIGTWTLKVIDASAGAVGTLDDWTIDLIGKAASPNQTFVFTNEFPAMVKAYPSRGTLVDPDGGNDTINAGALGLDNRIDLSGKTLSVLNGADLAIATGSRIENAVGGDGNDLLIANAVGSILSGMGGDDTLMGAAGNDTLDGGKGLNTAVFDGRLASFVVTPNSDGTWTARDSTGAEGTDTLQHIARLQFADGMIRLAADLTRVTPDGPALRELAQLNDSIGLRLQGFFLAYYCRPADYDGLTYWKQALVKALGGDQLKLAAAFGNPQQAEFAHLYGAGNTSADFVQIVYQNLFGRGTDDRGRDYWVSVVDREMAAGKGEDIARAEAAIWILDGAQAGDAAVVNARIASMISISRQIATYDQGNAFGDVNNSVAFAVARNWIQSLTAETRAPEIVLNALGAKILANAAVGGNEAQSSTNYTLPVEYTNLKLTGSASVIGIGNSADNLIYGNATGSLLAGGAGTDCFVVSGLSGNPDRVMDFAAGDLIALDTAGFAGLRCGLQTVQAYGDEVGSKAVLVYDQASGQLYYDADGAGSQLPLAILVLANAPLLNAGSVWGI